MGPRVASQVDDPPRTAPNALANVWARRLADRGLTHPSLRAEWLKDARRGVVTQSDFELLRLRVEDRLGPLEVGARAGISSEAVRRRIATRCAAARGRTRRPSSGVAAGARCRRVRRGPSPAHGQVDFALPYLREFLRSHVATRSLSTRSTPRNRPVQSLGQRPEHLAAHRQDVARPDTSRGR